MLDERDKQKFKAELENWLKELQSKEGRMNLSLEQFINEKNTQAILGPPPKNVLQFPILKTKIEYIQEEWNTTVVTAEGVVLGDMVEKAPNAFYTTQYWGRKMRITFYSKKSATEFLLLGYKQD